MRATAARRAISLRYRAMTKMYKLVLLIWTTTLLAAATEPIKPRIVGGTEASENEFPWQLSLQGPTGHHECGGSVLSDRFLITAAHCSHEDVDYYRVCAGSIYKYQPLSTHRVVKKFVYPGYSTTIYGASVDDIAIMEVDPPFQLGSGIAPVLLPSQCEPTLEGTLVTVTGWGLNETFGSQTDVLQKVQVPVVAHDKCNDIYIDIGGVAKGTICAGYEGGGKDSCRGDSGGPLVLGQELRGIVAWGVFCAEPGYPAIYTEVAYFRRWIYQITGV